MIKKLKGLLIIGYISNQILHGGIIWSSDRSLSEPCMLCPVSSFFFIWFLWVFPSMREKYKKSWNDLVVWLISEQFFLCRISFSLCFPSEEILDHVLLTRSSNSSRHGTDTSCAQRDGPVDFTDISHPQLSVPSGPGYWLYHCQNLDRKWSSSTDTADEKILLKCFSRTPHVKKSQRQWMHFSENKHTFPDRLGVPCWTSCKKLLMLKHYLSSSCHKSSTADRGKNILLDKITQSTKEGW